MKHKAIPLRITGCALTSGLMLYIFGRYSVELMGSYGYGLFLGLPFAGGFVSVLFFGEPLRNRLPVAACIGLYALAAGALFFLVTGFDGMICLLLASPLMVLLALIGVVAALLTRDLLSRLGTRNPNTRGPKVYCTAVLLIPLFVGMTAEPSLLPHPPTRMVNSSVVVHGDIATVWECVIAFPEITSPPGGIFNYGIAYPIRATIEGVGVGAIRRCTFNTGDFVEPITAWDAPHRLAFDVVENPLPMREWSPWGEIDALHLHGFMVSERGQFQLTEQADGTVLLEGTTWYHQNLWPNAYWGAISDRIIHQIHGRVLEHIKGVVEGGGEGTSIED